jgi:predicted nucleotidyltransferase
MATRHEIPSSLRAILRDFASALLARYGDDFAGLWLYGSYARGEARQDSDVDLLLLLRRAVQAGREIDRIGDLLAEVNLKHGVLLAVLPVEEQEFRRAEGAFWRNVRTDGFAA